MLLEYQILHNIHKVHDDILQKTVLLLCELLNMSILRAIQTRYVVTVDGCTKK